jgi:hypothetical protein
MYRGPHPLPSSTGNVGTQQTAAATGATTAEATGLTSDAGAQTATATPTPGQGGTGSATATPATVTVPKPTATSQKNGALGLKACWVTVVSVLGVLRVLLAVV